MSKVVSSQVITNAIIWRNTRFLEVKDEEICFYAVADALCTGVAGAWTGCCRKQQDFSRRKGTDCWSECSGRECGRFRNGAAENDLRKPRLQGGLGSEQQDGYNQPAADNH
ncbi:hypothetical protein D3C80_1553590 [compost metagenome]